MPIVKVAGDMELIGVCIDQEFGKRLKVKYNQILEEIDVKIEAELESANNASRKICLAAGLTSYFGRESVCLYGGTVNLLRNTLRPTHFLNFSRIIESSRRGCRSHSMGRITGDPFDSNNPLYGLVNYKKSYGGDVYVYVGDMRLARGTGLKMYLFTNLFPKIRHFRSTVLRNILNRKNLPSKGESR